MPYDSMMTRWQVAHISTGAKHGPPVPKAPPQSCLIRTRVRFGAKRTRVRFEQSRLGPITLQCAYVGVGSSLARWFLCW